MERIREQLEENWRNERSGQHGNKMKKKLFSEGSESEPRQLHSDSDPSSKPGTAEPSKTSQNHFVGRAT